MELILLIVGALIAWNKICKVSDKRWSQMSDEQKKEQIELWYADDYCDKDD